MSDSKRFHTGFCCFTFVQQPILPNAFSLGRSGTFFWNYLFFWRFYFLLDFIFLKTFQSRLLLIIFILFTPSSLMDLCSTAERYRGPSYGGSESQNGFFFWPWAAAAAANNYCGPGASSIDFENLYRFGYNSSTLISQPSHSSGYNQQMSSMSLLPPDMCMQQTDQYHNPMSVNTPGISSQISSDLYSNMSQVNAAMKSISPTNLTNNPGSLSLGMTSNSPTPVLKTSTEKSSNLDSAIYRNKFLSPLSSSTIPQYQKYSSHTRTNFNYHSSQSNSSCMESGPAPTKGYKCKMCQQLCFSRHDLARHNASAHKQDPRPYRCEHCGRQFSTGAYLGQHRRIHLGIKPYVCRFCERRFTQLSHVQQHERIHTGEKPYRCLSCLKSFTQMSNLQSHQRQHMKGKPYRCEHCFMCFDMQDEMDTHVQAKHAGHKYSKILVCPICGKNYNSETYLNKHIHKHKESAAAANMSVMAAAVNAVAVAAAHLPRHIGCSNPVIDAAPVGLNKRDHFYYPTGSNPYSLYSYGAPQPPSYLSNSSFMNPDLLTMGKDLSHFNANNIFSDPFDSQFPENAGVLCMKKEDQRSASKIFGEMQIGDAEAASNADDDDAVSPKSKSNDEMESSRQIPHQDINGVEAILGNINSNNLPMINFDTSGIDEMEKSAREEKFKFSSRIGAFNTPPTLRPLHDQEGIGSNSMAPIENPNFSSASDKSNLARLQELRESSMYHTQQSFHNHYPNHGGISSETYNFMQPLVFPNFRL